MRGYIIKRKGVLQWYNTRIEKIIRINDREIYADFIFYKKKDAKMYLETFPYKEYYEIIGVTLDNKKGK